MNFLHWVELPDGSPVSFGDLPAMIAKAIHAGEFAQIAACENLEKELEEMVTTRALRVRDRLTLGPHPFPIGDALRRAVLLPSDIRPILEARGIGLKLISAETRPHFHIPVRPIEVPAELLALPSNTEVLHTEAKKAGWSSSGACSAENLIHEIRQTIERQSKGWFFPGEAAQIVADAQDIQAREFYDRMGTAFSNGTLATFSTETKLKRQKNECWGLWDCFVTLASMDAWLEQDAPFRFPVMEYPAQTAPAAAPKTPPAPADPETASNSRGPTVKQAIAPYVARVMSERPDLTGEQLYQYMRRYAGSDGSPFAKLSPGGELFSIEAGAKCGLPTVRAALTGYRKGLRPGRSSTVEPPSNS